MKVQGFVEGSSLFDVTPIENLFISEYMTMAPGDYVKVYLYILNQCYFPAENIDDIDIAKELGMDEDEVKKALVYWAQLSLVEIVSRRPFSVRVKNIKHMLQNNAPKKQITNSNQDLIIQIQQSFGGRRLLNTSDTKKVLAWATNLKWSPEMIALVVSWCIEKKGRWVHLSYIDAVINSMNEQGISDYTNAEKYLLDANAKSSGATALLNAWHENRVATIDEMRLYDKWTHTWNISEDAITEARKNMVGISGNKFKYLDSILFSWEQRGIKSIEDAQSYYLKQKDIKEFSKAIYGNVRINEKIEQYFDQILGLGYSFETIVEMARSLNKQGIRDIESYYDVLLQWNSKGDKDDQALLDRAKYLDGIIEQTNQMVQHFGLSRRSNQNEVRAFVRWQEKGYTSEQIYSAAQLSTDANGKISYMNAILENEGKKITPITSKKRTDVNTGLINHDYSEDDFTKIWEAMEEI